MSTALGNHILVVFMNCDPHIMNDVAAIERDMVAAAQKAGAIYINHRRTEAKIGQKLRRETTEQSTAARPA